MKLSDIKGKRQLKVIGKLMGVMESVADDEAMKGFMEALKGGEDRGKALFKLGPLLERDDVADGLMEALACAKGIGPEEAEELNVFAELAEMVTEDSELPAFLSEQQ